MDDWKNEMSAVELEVEQETEQQEDVSESLNEEAEFARFLDAVDHLEVDTETSLKIIMELAAKDKGYALYKLSMLYSQGRYLPQDYEKAFQYAERGANVAGHFSSMSLLAEYYINGDVTKQDVSKGIEILTEGFETAKDVDNWVDSACVFANCLAQAYSRMDGYVDYEKALFYGRYGAKYDYYDTQVDLGDIYCDERYAGCDFKESNNWYQKALQHTDVMPDKQILIRASMVKNYLKMEEEDFDFDDAISLLDQIENDRKLLNGEDPLGGEDWYLRGEVYWKKRPVQYDKLINCFEIAAQNEKHSQQTIGRAAYKLAELYCKGWGVEENIDQGRMWMGKALECQNIEAWTESVLWGLFGDNVNWQEKLNTAMQCLELTNQSGSAFYVLGRVYLQAPAPYGDFLKAVECLNKAIEHKDTMFENYAMQSMDLGSTFIYLFGAYTMQNTTVTNYQKAYEIAKMQYEAGELYGANSLGKCYENGWGVERDIDKAIEYYSMWNGLFQEDKDRAEGIKRAEFIQKKGKMPAIASVAAVVVQYVIILNIAKHPAAFILSVITSVVVGFIAKKKLTPVNEKKVMMISAAISLVAGFIYPMIQF